MKPDLVVRIRGQQGQAATLRHPIRCSGSYRLDPSPVCKVTMQSLVYLEEKVDEMLGGSKG